MTDYYVCSKDIALRCCSGAQHMSAYCSIISDMLYSQRATFWSTELFLLKNVDNNMQTMLVLADPMFKKITEANMSIPLLIAAGYADKWAVIK